MGFCWLLALASFVMTLFAWLAHKTLIAETEPDTRVKKELALGQEANELIAILTALVKKARSNEDRGNAI